MSLLKNKTIGCIGAGNMGSAIVTGLSNETPGSNLLIYDIDEKKSDTLSKKYSINSANSAEAVVKGSDIIIIAVKPDIVSSVLDQIKNFAEKKVLVSIAAGVRINYIEDKIGSSKKIIRVMPNISALVGEGMIILSPNKNIDNDVLDIVENIFSYMGKVLVMPEKMMDAVTGVSGSGPAYVFTFIQAMTDGGVKMGLPRDKALILATQTVLGAAKLVFDSGEAPISLRDRVTSPGGTTIDAVHILERGGFSGIVIDAIETATNKSKKLGGK